MDIQWQEPPPSDYQKRHASDDFAAALAKNPGRWAVYRTGARVANHGWSVAKRHQLERTARVTDDGYTIYMRAPKGEQ